MCSFKLKITTLPNMTTKMGGAMDVARVHLFCKTVEITATA